MTDLPPPPPPKGALPQSEPEARDGASNRGNHPTPWIWVAGGIVIAVIAVAIAIVAAQRGEDTTQTAEEHPAEDAIPTPTATPTPTPTPAEIIYPETFDWTVPDVIGMTKNEARAAIQDSVASAMKVGDVSFGEAYDLRVSINWSERESQEPKGTVLDMRRYEAGDELTLTPTNNATRGDRVTINVGLVAATPPIRFPGDSIYIDGSGSAMVTWLDSNFDIIRRRSLCPLGSGFPLEWRTTTHRGRSVTAAPSSVSFDTTTRFTPDLGQAGRTPSVRCPPEATKADGDLDEADCPWLGHRSGQWHQEWHQVRATSNRSIE